MTRICGRVGVGLIGGLVMLSAAGLSCTRSEEDEGVIRLVVFETANRPGEKAVWKLAIKRFEAGNPGVKVDVRNSKADDYPKLHLPQALGSNRPPDVYFHWAGYAVRHHAAGNIAQDISPFFANPETKDRFDPRSFTGTTFEGRHYMLPVSMTVACVMWYQKSLLAEHGIEPPMTWGAFVSACKRLKAAGITPVVNGNQPGWPIANWAAQMAEVYLGYDDYCKIGIDKPTVALDDPRIVKAVKRIEELAKMGAFNKDINSLDGDEGMSLFIRKKGAFYVMGGWTAESVDSKDVGVSLLPILPDAPVDHRSVMANSAGYLFHKRSKHLAESLKLFTMFTSVEVQTLATRYGMLTTVTEPHRSITNPLVKQLLGILKQSDVWVGAPDIAWKPAIAESFMAAVKSVVGGDQTAEEALRAAAQEVAAMTR